MQSIGSGENFILRTTNGYTNENYGSGSHCPVATNPVGKIPFFFRKNLVKNKGHDNERGNTKCPINVEHIMSFGEVNRTNINSFLPQKVGFGNL